MSNLNYSTRQPHPTQSQRRLQGELVAHDQKKLALLARVNFSVHRVARSIRSRERNVRESISAKMARSSISNVVRELFTMYDQVVVETCPITIVLLNLITSSKN